MKEPVYISLVNAQKAGLLNEKTNKAIFKELARDTLF